MMTKEFNKIIVFFAALAFFAFVSGILLAQCQHLERMLEVKERENVNLAIDLIDCKEKTAILREVVNECRYMYEFPEEQKQYYEEL